MRHDLGRGALQVGRAPELGRHDEVGGGAVAGAALAAGLLLAVLAAADLAGELGVGEDRIRGHACHLGVSAQRTGEALPGRGRGGPAARRLMSAQSRVVSCLSRISTSPSTMVVSTGAAQTPKMRCPSTLSGEMGVNGTWSETMRSAGAPTARRPSGWPKRREAMAGFCLTSISATSTKPTRGSRCSWCRSQSAARTSSLHVGGHAVGAEADADAALDHVEDPRGAHGVVHVRLRVVHDDGVGLAEEVDLLVGEVDAVDGERVAAQAAGGLEPLDHALAVAS